MLESGMYVTPAREPEEVLPVLCLSCCLCVLCVLLVVRRWHQYPFIYVILGGDKCVLIDTGCVRVCECAWDWGGGPTLPTYTGAVVRMCCLCACACRCGLGDLRAFVDAHINTNRLPYLVINTHVHFDVSPRLRSVVLALCLCFVC